MTVDYEPGWNLISWKYHNYIYNNHCNSVNCLTRALRSVILTSDSWVSTQTRILLLCVSKKIGLCWLCSSEHTTQTLVQTLRNLELDPLSLDAIT